MKAVNWPLCPGRFQENRGGGGEKCVPETRQILDVARRCCDQRMPQLIWRCICAMYSTPLMNSFNGSSLESH